MQGEVETEEDYFRPAAAAAQQSSRGKDVVPDEEMGGIGGVEELCTVSWEEGEEAVPSQEEQEDAKEVHLSKNEEGVPSQLKGQLFSQSYVATSAIVQQSEQTC